MEVIGTVGAVVGLVGALGSVSKALYGCIRTMRLADRDAYLTHTELTTLGHLLMQFYQLVTNHDSQGAQLNGQTGLQNPVVSQGKHLIRKMKRVLKEIGMFDEGGLQTGRQRWLSRLRWYIRKKEVLQLCVQFNQVKMSIMAFVSMVGLESVRNELKKVRDELKKMHREQLPGCEERIARLWEIRRQLERRVKAFKIEVEAAEAAYEMAAREVRQQSPLPEVRDLSRELDRSVRRVSKIVTNKEPENNSRRHRHSTSRRTSRRSPSADWRSTRRPPPGPTSPSSGSTMVTVPSNTPPPPPPAPAAVYHPGQSLQREGETDQPSEEGIIAPLVTRDPRYFRDFRNEPFPDRQESSREHPEDSSANEEGEPAESPTEPPYGQGTYVNPENPQDRRRRLPNGRLSER